MVDFQKCGHVAMCASQVIPPDFQSFAQGQFALRCRGEQPSCKPNVVAHHVKNVLGRIQKLQNLKFHEGKKALQSRPALDEAQPNEQFDLQQAKRDEKSNLNLDLHLHNA